MREDLVFTPPGSLLAGEKMENPSGFRAKLCLCLLLIGFAAVGVQLVSIQVFHHDFWVQYVDKQRESAITIYPKRGDIRDRTGEILATSVVQEILCVAPKRVTDIPKLARALSPYANMPAEKIVEKLSKTRLHLVYLRRGLDLETAKKITSMKLEGVEFRSEHSRRYPKGSLGSNMIGFANLENKGLEGIEYKFDSRLAGEAGKQIVVKDNSRREIAALAQTVKQARDGNHIILTIDEFIQYCTGKALDGIVTESSPESAVAVVIKPQTGEVLAMACRPTFDPNKPSTYRPERLRNRVIVDAFEPGSAFKPVAAAAALERNVITPEDRVYCELGSMRYHGHTFNDVHPYAEISFANVLAHSSNIGMIKVVSLLQPRCLYDYIKGFGFGQLTGIDLPGESVGIIRPPSKWSGLSMGSLPIGQEISVTALQLASAFSVIANNGKLMRPYVISEIQSPEGKTLKRTKPQFVRQAIRPETAKNLTRMLELAVTSGTGTAAKIKGYRIAGKTGTAQKANLSTGGYYRNRYVAVFAGFVPADDPAACIVIVADSPKGRYYGGQVAAPAFREIALGVLNHFEIAPTEPDEQIFPEQPGPVLAAYTPDREVGKKGPVTVDADGPRLMPDVRGMTMTAILNLLSPYSLCFEFEGSGVASRQKPAPGMKIEEGQRCHIAFKRIGAK